MFATPTSRSFRRAAAFAPCIPLALAACQAAPPLEEQSAEAPPAAETPAPEYTLGPENSHNRWSSTIPPQLTVPSGAVVEVFTKEASDGQITESTTAEDLANVDFDLIHALTGPIYVEGASPGDILAVTLHEIEVQGWGWAGIFPGFGFLADEITGPWIRGFPMEPGATEVAFNDDITIPLAPFAGVMGVAPDTDSMLVTIPPRTNGGNMDNRHMIAGTTVYFPVQVEGALFSIGDAHAAQGDGEVSGSAIETPVRVVFEVEVMENTRGMVEPQYESDDYYAVTGFGTTIDEAARKATRYMIDYLVAEHGLTREEAYVLCSIAGDMKISETVDVPHMLVSMHMPKGIF
ncbi:MAG: acetamidase/formamidase family protein [Gammaproteobacteria bacterium]|nr:acetamidase/formamidase family protein [Gammaproteobacteria bacterium]MDE0259162.1 acetamidase/formamidase family protein [Gammaproteobacteria bacterium]